MKSEKKILAAFCLNLFFSGVELAGGLLTGSVAILSDALHDLGDSVSIGAAFFLEKRSRKEPDQTHTYGYLRYSVLGSLLTTMILLVGSCLVIGNAVHRLLYPVPIHPAGMLGFAVFGAAVNLAAAWFTGGAGSLNQRAVNLHMLEDVLGWLAVLAGAVVIRLTGLLWLDPVLSIGVALFIFLHAAKNLETIADLFLDKAPHGLDLNSLAAGLGAVEGVLAVQDLRVRSLDGISHIATVYIVATEELPRIKAAMREEFSRFGIFDVTIETGSPGERREKPVCPPSCRHHHHHHH